MTLPFDEFSLAMNENIYTLIFFSSLVIDTTNPTPFSRLPCDFCYTSGPAHAACAAKRRKSTPPTEATARSEIWVAIILPPSTALEMEWGRREKVDFRTFGLGAAEERRDAQ